MTFLLASAFRALALAVDVRQQEREIARLAVTPPLGASLDEPSAK